MPKKYFYASYSNDDKIIDVYNNIGEIVTKLYRIDKYNPLYRIKYLQMHRSISRHKNINCFWIKKFNLKLYRIETEE